MKIPQITAQVEPGVAAQPHASGAALAAPYTALYQGAQYVQRVAEQIATTNRAMHDQGVKIESNALGTQMETNAKLAINDLKATETDPDGYMTKSKQAIEGAYKSTLEMAKYPETKAALAQKYLQIQATVGVDVAEHRNQLYKDRNEGLLMTNLAELRRLGSLAPDQPGLSDFGPGEAPGMYTKAKGTVDYFEEGVKAIFDATPILGTKKRDALLEKWKQDYLYGRAETQLRANAGFDVSHFAGVLNPENYDRLVARKDSLLRQQTAAEERAQEKLKKETEEARQYKLAHMSQLVIENREAGQDQQNQRLIDQALQIGLIKNRTEYEHYRELSVKRPDRPSDPIVLNELRGKVFHPYSTSMALIPEIQRAMTAHALGGKGLSDEHGTSLLNHLSSAITAKDKDDYTRAKEEGFRALGITTPMSQLTKKEAKLVSAFEEQFNAIARPQNPNGIAPRDALYQLLPIFKRQQDADAKLTYQEKAALLKGLTQSDIPDPLDPKWLLWWGDQVRATEALANDPTKSNLYRLQKQQLLDLKEERDNARAIWLRSLEGASGGSSSSGSSRSVGGYTPPGAK